MLLEAFHQVSPKEELVWKILFEEFQDGCLVLGNFWYAKWMILAISESPCC